MNKPLEIKIENLLEINEILMSHKGDWISLEEAVQRILEEVQKGQQ